MKPLKRGPLVERPAKKLAIVTLSPVGGIPGGFDTRFRHFGLHYRIHPVD